MNKKKTILTIFTLILLIIFFSCSEINPFYAGGVVPGGNWIYFAEGSTIKKMRLDGTEVESVFTFPDGGMYYAKKIQLDPIREKMFVLYSLIAPPGSKIIEYNLDGTGANEILDSGISYDIWDMNIDSGNGYLYFIPGNNGIKSYNFATSQFSDVYTGTLGTTPFFVTPDYRGGQYFVETGNLNKVTGTGSYNIITSVGSIYGLCYEKIENYLYTTAMTGMIYKINPLNGASTGIATFEDLDYAPVISTSEKRIYFYDRNAMVMPYTIFSINMDGSDKKVIYTNDFGISAFDILSK